MRQIQKICRVTALSASLALAAALLPVVPVAHAAGVTLTVGKNGTYQTVGAAVAAAAALNPAGEGSRVTVAIEPGVYREQLLINTPYLTFINSNPDGGDVTLTWYYGIGYNYYSAAGSGYYSESDARAKSAKGKAQRWGTAVRLQNGAKYFRAENIRFENSFNLYMTEEELADGVEPNGESLTVQRFMGLDVTAKSATERASALCVEADYCEFLHCSFVSSQDTLYTETPAYFKECRIQGNTDYIFGKGDVVFDACELCFGGYSDKAAGGYITAARQQTLGYLFWNCKVTANPGKTVGAGFFGRPWRDTAHVLFYNTALQYEGIIQSAGWTSMSGVDPAQATFREYHTTVNGAPVNTGGRTRGTVLNSCDATREQYLGSWSPYYLTGTVTETAVSVNTAEQYTLRNAGNGMYLSAADGSLALSDKADAAVWTFADAGDGFYTMTAGGVSQTVRLISAANGCELVTKDSESKLCLGADSTGVQPQERSGDAAQQWTLVPHLAPVSGKLIDLTVFDREHAKDWSVAETVKNGDPVFGDRDVTLLNLPEELTGAEYVRTACNSKNVKGDLAEITAKVPVTVYLALDQRIDPPGAWLSDWQQTPLSLDNTGEVHFICYAKTLAAGESVTLGENSQSSYCVNYLVFAKALPQAETTQTTAAQTTTTQTTTTQTTTTETTTSEEAVTTAAQSGLPGDVNCDGKVTVSDAILLARIVAEDSGAKVTDAGMRNADLDGKDGLSADDTVYLLKMIAGMI